MSPADLAALEQRLAVHLARFETMDSAWPRAPGAVERAPRAP
jgi:hypothetical protein